MPIRISGVTLQDKKHILFALTDIYGIGRASAAKILQELSLNPEVKARELTEKEEHALREYIEKNIKVEGELRRDVTMHIKHHRDIGTYRGLRHAKHLPVRGQRTRTNSRTVRGNVRKTAGSGRKMSDQKT